MRRDRQQRGIYTMDAYESKILEILAEMGPADRLDYMNRLAEIAMAEFDAMDRQRYLEAHFLKTSAQPQDTRPPLSPLEVGDFRLSPASFPDLG
jgi:hypothetical protein